MATVTNSVLDIFGALISAEDKGVLPVGTPWSAVNDTQSFLLELLAQNRNSGQLGQFALDGLLKKMFTLRVVEINKWFQDNGLSISLKDGGPGAAYIGGIYEQLVNWIAEGEQIDINAVNGKAYEGVGQFAGVQFYQSPKLSVPVVSIMTEGRKDKVYMVKMGLPSSDPLGLLAFIMSIQSNLTPTRDYNAVEFPMLNADVSPDTSWVLGMGTVLNTGLPVIIQEAQQQSIFKLNHEGAFAKSGFGAMMSFSTPPPQRAYTIDDCFLVWISREGIELPLFAIHADYDVWENPGGLD